MIVASLALATGLYALGVRRVHRRRGAAAWRTSRLACFLGGVATLLVALVSPIEAYSDRLLSVHMAQHLALTLVAPPLLLMGRPVTLAHVALPAGPRAWLTRLARGRTMRTLTSPAVGFGSFAVVMWVSHLTPVYETALTNEAVHAFEHLAYLATAMLFWWPVVAGDPGSARLSYPARLLYVFLSMPVMSLLGFVVSSANRVLYPPYVATAGRTAALADQRLGGTIMWESTMVMGAVALSAVLLGWMGRDEADARRADARRERARARAVREAGGITVERGRA